MEVVRAGAVRLAFERWGAGGEPVALIHGGWHDHRMWNRVAQGLAASLEVLTYDRRGHGETVGPPRRFPVREDASDLAALLESIDLFPAHLVGHGYGGSVALRLAADRPELVRSVVLHEMPYVRPYERVSPGSPEELTVVERLSRVRERALNGEAGEAAGEFLRLFGSADEQKPPVAAALRLAMETYARPWTEELADPEALSLSVDALRSIPIPVLALTGGASPPFAQAVQELLVADLPNATSLRLREGGHFTPLTHPDLFVGVLGMFLLERNVPTS